MTTTNTGRPRGGAKPRKSRFLRRLVVTVIVLGALLVAADFGAAAFFEHEVAKRAQQQFGLKDHPSVTVGGFSFLAQAVSGEYDHVTIEAKGVPVRDKLRDLEIYANLRGVRAPLSDIASGSLKGVPVREVDGEVRVKAADINRAIQTDSRDMVRSITNLTIDPVSEQAVLTPPADGEETKPEPEVADEAGGTAGARLCGTVDIAGQSTELCAFGLISLAGQNIHLEAKRLELRNGGSDIALPATVRDLLLTLFSRDITPGALPFEVTPTAVTVRSGQLSIRGKAADVVLGRAS